GVLEDRLGHLLDVASGDLLLGGQRDELEERGESARIVGRPRDHLLLELEGVLRRGRLEIAGIERAAARDRAEDFLAAGPRQLPLELELDAVLEPEREAKEVAVDRGVRDLAGRQSRPGRFDAAGQLAVLRLEIDDPEVDRLAVLQEGELPAAG